MLFVLNPIKARIPTNKVDNILAISDLSIVVVLKLNPESSMSETKTIKKRS